MGYNPSRTVCNHSEYVPAAREPPAPVNACKFIATYRQGAAKFQTMGPGLEYLHRANRFVKKHCHVWTRCEKSNVALGSRYPLVGNMFTPRLNSEAWASSLGKTFRAGMNSHLRISQRPPELRVTYKFKTRFPFRQMRAMCSNTSPRMSA